MNKDFKVIQINGLSGVLILGFITTGMVCGFILFPIWVLMMGWNSIVAEIFKGPTINYFQGMFIMVCHFSVFLPAVQKQYHYKDSKS